MVDIRTPSGERIAGDSGPIGLALSGSGLKASLFHIGVLARLAELDLLRQVDVISATGGGAVIAALYHLHLKRALDTDGDVDTGSLAGMIASLERDFLAFVQTDLRARLFANPIANLKRLSTSHSSASRLGTLLERHLFRPVWQGASDQPIEMRDLAIHPRGDREFNPVTDNQKRHCKAPWLIINAANLGTGRTWRFDAERMGEPAAGPAARRLSRAPLLTQSLYRRLPETYAGMTLGAAVAASMATPGLLEPLRLSRLYPDPERPSSFLDIRLGDGRLADALGTEVLIERGCSRLIVSDGSGFETRLRGSSDNAESLQLAALEANRPGGVVLVPMLREIEALEVKPIGPIRHGHVTQDNADNEVTSYGVKRSLQKLIAGMRTDLDAPSETEAMTLMANGYLITKRAFQQHRASGLSWAHSLPLPPQTWRFTVVIDALRKPSRKLIKNLKTARLPAFRGPRLALGEAFGFGLFFLATAFTMVALGAFWSGLRPAAGADGTWILTTLGLLAAAAWFAGRHVGDGRQTSFRSAGLKPFFGWINKLSTVLLAVPLAVVARFRRRASRAFVNAGQLKNIGLEPIVHEKPAAAQPAVNRRKPSTQAAEPERKAA